jgi:lipoprotein-releasing system ATP-binding protein
MIQINGLEKNYGNLQVLKGINLEIADRSVISIVGASGAGKSTLLHIIGTLDKPTKGTVLIDNTDLYTLSDKKLAQYRNQNIGFIFQFHHLLPEFTAVENVALPALIAGQSHADAFKRATELLDFLKLKDRLTHKPSQLSGGEQQRVAVARALANNPKLVLADEPSGNLDTANARKLHQLFLDLRDEFGQTFVVVTHNTELAQLADKTIEMKDGKIISC